jgi:PilZ domain
MVGFGGRKLGVGRSAKLDEVAPESAEDNRRAASRKSTRALAYIVCGETGKTEECVVLDVSASGAKIQLNTVSARPFSNQPRLPKTFKLILRNDNTEIDCRVAWVNATSCGVEFTSRFRPTRFLR